MISGTVCSRSGVLYSWPSDMVLCPYLFSQCKPILKPAFLSRSLTGGLPSLLIKRTRYPSADPVSLNLAYHVRYHLQHL